MPNGATHSIVGEFSGLAVAMLDKDDSGDNYHNPLSVIGIGTVFGKLPDILEPRRFMTGNPKMSLNLL